MVNSSGAAASALGAIVAVMAPTTRWRRQSSLFGSLLNSFVLPRARPPRPPITMALAEMRRPSPKANGVLTARAVTLRNKRPRSLNGPGRSDNGGGWPWSQLSAHSPAFSTVRSHAPTGV